MVLGCSGSGKSTFSQRLANKLNIKVVHLDSYFWNEGWVETPREQWLEMQHSFISQDSWIIDGNYTATIDKRLEQADTVFYLDFPTPLCLYGIIKRRFQHKGKTRPDMAPGCPEKIDWEFFNYVRTFNRKKAPKLKRRIYELTDKCVIIFKTRREIDEFFEKIDLNS
jgi:adenylate kinase family enzyme